MLKETPRREYKCKYTQDITNFIDNTFKVKETRDITLLERSKLVEASLPDIGKFSPSSMA